MKGPLQVIGDPNDRFSPSYLQSLSTSELEELLVLATHPNLAAGKEQEQKLKAILSGSPDSGNRMEGPDYTSYRSASETPLSHFSSPPKPRARTAHMGREGDAPSPLSQTAPSTKPGLSAYKTPAFESLELLASSPYLTLPSLSQTVPIISPSPLENQVEEQTRSMEQLTEATETEKVVLAEDAEGDPTEVAQEKLQKNNQQQQQKQQKQQQKKKKKKKGGKRPKPRTNRKQQSLERALALVQSLDMPSDSDDEQQLSTSSIAEIVPDLGIVEGRANTDMLSMVTSQTSLDKRHDEQHTSNALQRQLVEQAAELAAVQANETKLRELVGQLLGTAHQQHKSVRERSFWKEMGRKDQLDLLRASEPDPDFEIDISEVPGHHYHRDEVHKLRAQLAQSNAENKNLKRQVESLTDKNHSIITTNGKERALMIKKIKKQQGYLMGAVRRVKHLIAEKDKSQKSHRSEQTYIRQLEAKLVSLSTRLQKRQGVDKRGEAGQKHPASQALEGDRNGQSNAASFASHGVSVCSRCRGEMDLDMRVSAISMHSSSAYTADASELSPTFSANSGSAPLHKQDLET